MEKPKNNNHVTFIPNLFKANSTKSTQVVANDPFITEESGREYSSVLATSDDNLPKYLQHYKNFTDNVLDIAPNVLEDIAKMHVEREMKFKEEERKEDENKAQQEALEMKVKRSLDKRVDEILSSREYYVKRSCPVKIPFKSTLNHEEHNFYLRAFIKFQMRPPANSLEQKEYEQYLSMQNRVFHEQSCVMNFSYKAAQLLLKNYNAVPSVIDKYISDYFLLKSKRALSYPACYRNEVEIPLKPQESKAVSDHFQLVHVGHLLSLGEVPMLRVPKRNFPTNFPMNESVEKKKRAEYNAPIDRDIYLYKCPVSEDPNAEYLAKAHGASIVMSSSAFKTIVDNQEQPFDKEWDIPIRIKSFKIEDKSGKEVQSRIVFIDKPLPKKSWFPMQKKNTFFKASAKSYMGLINSYKLPNCPKKIFTQYQFSGASSEEATHYGSFFSTSQKKKNKKKKKPKPFAASVSPTDDIAKDLFLSDEDDMNSSSDSRSGSSSFETFAAPSNGVKKMDGVADRAGAPLHRPESPFGFEAFATPSNCVGKMDVDGVVDRAGAPLHCPESPYGIGTFAAPSNCVRKVDNVVDRGSVSLDRPKSPSGTQTSTPPVEMTPSSIPSKPCSSQGEGGLLDDLLGKQESFLKPKTVSGPSENEPPRYNQVPFNYSVNQRKISDCPRSDTIHTDWNGHMIKQCPRGNGINIHYQLFSLERTEQSPVKEERVEPIRILVRHNIHAISKCKQSKSKKAYILYPKLENQVYFGCEVNSITEIAQQWAGLAIRPNTALLQARICVDSGALVMTEKKTLETIVKEGKQNHLDFNPQNVFSTLYVLFSTLRRMCSSDYLLHHSSKTEAFMKLLRAVESEVAMYPSSYKLHEMYSERGLVNRYYKTAPWLAIDTHVLTPFHKFHHKIPATFPMENKTKLKRDERKRRVTKAKTKLAIEGYE